MMISLHTCSLASIAVGRYRLSKYTWWSGRSRIEYWTCRRTEYVLQFAQPLQKQLACIQRSTTNMTYQYKTWSKHEANDHWRTWSKSTNLPKLLFVDDRQGNCHGTTSKRALPWDMDSWYIRNSWGKWRIMLQARPQLLKSSHLE